MSSAIIEHADGLPQPQRSWAIFTIALGLVMAVVDGAIAAAREWFAIALTGSLSPGRPRAT